MKTTIQVADLVLAFLLVTVVASVAIFCSPYGLSDSDYTWRQQAMIRSLNMPMPILGAIAIILALISAFLHRPRVQARCCWLAGAFFLILSGLITRFGNQPINAVVMTWNPNAMPSDWQMLRDQWWHWHMLRTILSIMAFVSLVSGFMLGRKETPASECKSA